MLSKEPSVNLISNLEADFRSQNAEALQKIAIFADLSEGFTIGFVEVNLERDRNFAIAALEARNDTDLQWISLQFSDPDLRYLIAAITEALQRVELIPEKKIILLISGLERTIGGYGDYPPLLSNLNVARDTYTHKLPYPMLFFLPSYAMTRFARFAPDFWAWKSIEVRLQSDMPVPELAVAEMPQISNDQKVFPVTQERFDLLYRLLTEYPQPSLTRADLLDQLGDAYKSYTQYVKAEIAYQESLNLYQKLLGDSHPKVANSLNNLAALYRAMGRYSDAEPLYGRSLHIYETHLGANHPYTATSLNNLAALYYVMGRYNDAETLYGRSLQIRETQLRADHPDTAQSLNNLAELYRAIGRYSDAETLYRRSLQIRETQLGSDHPDTAASLNNLAALYEAMGRNSDAEPLYVRSLRIMETQLGSDHPSTGASLNNLAGLYRAMGRYSEAEPLYLRTLEIWTKSLGEDHPHTQTAWDNFRHLLHQALTNGSADSLSPHPLTQQLLQELRE